MTCVNVSQWSAGDMEREWDRRKAYLTRCLSEDLPFLSPILERIEGSYTDDRPYSPLPDLIIEKEKSRHDESDEYYEELEKRMLKLYRRLFLCQHDHGSIGSINSFSGQSNFQLIDETTQDSDDGDVEEYIRVSEEGISSNESLRDIETEEDSEEPRHEVITTEALIHAEVEQRVNRDSTTDLTPQRSPILECKHVQQVRKDWKPAFYRRRSEQDATKAAHISPIHVKSFKRDANVARLVSRQATAQTYSISSSHSFQIYDFSPIEVMRQNASDNSKYSFPEVKRRKSSMDTEIVTNLNDNQACPIEITPSLVEGFSDGSVVASASDLLKNALRDVTKVSSPIIASTSRKRPHSDSSNEPQEPPRKIANYKNTGPQTIIEGTLSNISPPRSASPINYFTGTPSVFNVCRCNHICQ